MNGCVIKRMGVGVCVRERERVRTTRHPQTVE